tara:strand:- start:1531 stop:1818 length:288 start_codon:yes stop_codon:yes gene_type:complete
MKLRVLSETGDFKMVRASFSPAVVYIQFPNEDVWEYLIYDDALLNQLLRQHGRNTGRLVANLKQFKSRKVKIGSEKDQLKDKPKKRQKELFNNQR